MLNYIRPNNGEGIKVYVNGAEVVSSTTKEGGLYPTGDGRIAVGRVYTDREQGYASVLVDELIYFDAVLTIDDVGSIYNSA